LILGRVESDEIGRLHAAKEVGRCVTRDAARSTVQALALRSWRPSLR
jgi:hypothetical protein